MAALFTTNEKIEAQQHPHRLKSWTSRRRTMVFLLPGSAGRRPVDGSSWVWRHLDKRESKGQTRMQKEAESHTYFLKRKKQQQIKLGDYQEKSPAARFSDFAIWRQNENKSTDLSSGRFKIQADPKLVEVVLRSVPTLLDFEPTSNHLPLIDREYQLSSSYTDGFQDSEKLQDRSSIETVLNTWRVTSVNQRGLERNADKSRGQELLNAFSKKKNPILHVSRFLRGRDGSSVHKRVIGTQTSLIPYGSPEGCSDSAVCLNHQQFCSAAQEQQALSLSQEKESTVEDIQFDAAVAASLDKKDSMDETFWSRVLQKRDGSAIKSSGYLDSFIPFCPVTICGVDRGTTEVTEFIPTDQELHHLTYSKESHVQPGAQVQQNSEVLQNATASSPEVAADEALQGIMKVFSKAQPAADQIPPLFGNFVPHSNQRSGRGGTDSNSSDDSPGIVVKSVDPVTAMNVWNAEYADKECREPEDTKVDELCEEESRQRTKCEEDLPSVRIIPLFGFMSSLIGQCYLVSLSPNNENIVENVPGQQTTTFERDERVRRFVERITTGNSKILSRDKPEDLEERDMDKNESPVLESKEQREDASKSTITGSGATSDIIPVPMLGLLRRVGDEYFVDPLSSSSYHEFEVGLSQFQEATLDEPEAPSSFPSDALSWEAKAAATAFEAKERISSVFNYLGKIGAMTPQSSEVKVMEPETSSSETAFDVGHALFSVPKIVSNDRASKLTDGILEVNSSLDTAGSNPRKWLYSTLGFSI